MNVKKFLEYNIVTEATGVDSSAEHQIRIKTNIIICLTFKILTQIIKRFENNYYFFLIYLFGGWQPLSLDSFLLKERCHPWPGIELATVVVINY